MVLRTYTQRCLFFADKRDTSICRLAANGETSPTENLTVCRMVAMFDYDPKELSPNVDAEVCFTNIVICIDVWFIGVITLNKTNNNNSNNVYFLVLILQRAHGHFTSKNSLNMKLTTPIGQKALYVIQCND